eukprot:11184382-Lingulodinium_polyedra.AAC.1
MATERRGNVVAMRWPLPVGGQRAVSDLRGARGFQGVHCHNNTEVATSIALLPCHLMARAP